MSIEADRQRAALHRIAADDPELAARVILMTLPAAAARISGALVYQLDVEELGSYLVSVSGGRARVDEARTTDDSDFRLQTDARSLVELVTGTAGPLGLMMRGRLRIRGKRRRAMKLRQMSSADLSMAEVVEAGGTLEPDILYRSLPYLIDPDWTQGHDFTVAYDVTGDGGGSWYVTVRDGEPLVVTREPPDGREVLGTASVSFDSYQRMASGQVSPAQGMQNQLTTIEGKIHPITLLGRWIARAQGADDAELKREKKQRKLQEQRANLYVNGGVGGPGQGDPGHDAEGGARDGGGLLDYRQLYALWERQNWKATELDFTVDKEQWVTTPREAQESTIWSLGSFYVGEERVTADLAPFLQAAPSGEIELFLATQLVDEARHAAFFDRFGAEVMCLAADDFRGRMREVEKSLLSPWRDVFDDGLRDVAKRIQAKPDDLDLFVEGVTTYHMVVEGFLAVTGQTLIRDYMLEHGMYPGFCEGFGLVERDEHRHVAFGVRFLRDAIEQDARYRQTVERVVLDLAPKAAYVFVPPYVKDASDFVSYGYTSRQIYGFAYRTLKRRMKVLGIEVPPPEELLPGPIEGAAPAAAEPAAKPAAAVSNGSGSNGSGDLEAAATT
ncbi:MAG TPA: SCP2 sterol-binding domain-containing protein [Thermoleophilaceae bacterium]|nr:SCP2 sterol-binding domain-containing protein [Thermoleophilaceae bacterium]